MLKLDKPEAYGKRLFRYLELASFNQFAALIEKLVDINPPVEIGKVHRSMVGEVALFKHLPPNETVDLDGKSFIVSFLEIKSDKSGCRVGIKPEYGSLHPRI